MTQDAKQLESILDRTSGAKIILKTTCSRTLWRCIMDRTGLFFSGDVLGQQRKDRRAASNLPWDMPRVATLRPRKLPHYAIRDDVTAKSDQNKQRRLEKAIGTNLDVGSSVQASLL